MSRLAKMLPFFYALVDTASVIFSLLLIINIFQMISSSESIWILLAGTVLIWLGLTYITNLYSSNLHNGVRLRISDYLKSHFYFAFLTFLVKLFLPTVVFLSYFQLFYFIVCFAILNTSINYIVVATISRFRRRNENIKNTLIIGVGDVALRMSSYIKSCPDFGFIVKGHISVKNEDCKIDSNLIVSSLSQLETYLNEHPIDEIIIALTYKKAKTKKVNRIIDMADHMGARISFVPDYEGLLGKNFQTIQQNEIEAIKIHRMPLDGVYPTLEKVFFDFVFSFVALVLLSPLFILTAITIKVDSRGPILYCPIRVGRNGRNFKLYKFRTMRESDDELSGTKSTQKNDQRITRIGRTLRKYNIDELPQFINVLIGDMSVVGPRPHRNYLNEIMKLNVEKYMLRHYFRPGITGWAQVNGWRGPTETEEQINQRTAHDLWYIENWSFLLDLKIILMTIFSRKALQNAY